MGTAGGTLSPAAWFPSPSPLPWACCSSCSPRRSWVCCHEHEVCSARRACACLEAFVGILGLSQRADPRGAAGCGTTSCRATTSCKSLSGVETLRGSSDSSSSAAQSQERKWKCARGGEAEGPSRELLDRAVRWDHSRGL